MAEEPRMILKPKIVHLQKHNPKGKLLPIKHIQRMENSFRQGNLMTIIDPERYRTTIERGKSNEYQKALALNRIRTYRNIPEQQKPNEPENLNYIMKRFEVSNSSNGGRRTRKHQRRNISRRRRHVGRRRTHRNGA